MKDSKKLQRFVVTDKADIPAGWLPLSTWNGSKGSKENKQYKKLWKLATDGQISAIRLFADGQLDKRPVTYILKEEALAFLKSDDEKPKSKSKPSKREASSTDQVIRADPKLLAVLELIAKNLNALTLAGNALRNQQTGRHATTTETSFSLPKTNPSQNGARI